MGHTQDPNRKEVLFISSLEVREPRATLVMFEMVRDSGDEDRLVELRELQLIDTDAGEVESPLLSAFVDGFRVGTRGQLTN